MLLVKTELRSSGIHGLGVFAVDPIPKGELVWEFLAAPVDRRRSEVILSLGMVVS